MGWDTAAASSCHPAVIGDLAKTEEVRRTLVSTAIIEVSRETAQAACQNSPLLELALLARFDHLARFIVNANHSISRQGPDRRSGKRLRHLQNIDDFS